MVFVTIVVQIFFLGCWIVPLWNLLFMNTQNNRLKLLEEIERKKTITRLLILMCR